jgi:hypothetical protein
MTDGGERAINFLVNFLARNQESIDSLRKVMCHEGVETFISFLKILKTKGWL